MLSLQEVFSDMIFVVLGTQKFQCNRLLMEIDRLVEQKIITEEVFAQRGYSDYVPKYYDSVDFLKKEEFEEKMGQCSLLISHSGVGTILSAVNHKKPVIVCPRLKKYKEHVDDHQLEIAKAFEKKQLVLMYREEADLSELIEQSKSFSFGTYTSQREKVIETIKMYLREEIRDV